MSPPPFTVRLELAGWSLFWALLALDAGDPAEAAASLAAADPAGRSLDRPGEPASEDWSAALRREAEARARSQLDLARLAEHPTAAAVRALFRAAGCDPTRHRPSSEALLRRVLKGEPLPAVHPFVDLNNCLSMDLLVPSCVAAEGSFDPPVTLRAGAAGEGYDSLRGPFNLEGKPLLADLRGPFGTPITDSQRVKVLPETRRAWLVAYLPAGVVAPELAAAALTALLTRLRPVRLALSAAS